MEGLERDFKSMGVEISTIEDVFRVSLCLDIHELWEDLILQIGHCKLSTDPKLRYRLFPP